MKGRIILKLMPRDYGLSMHVGFMWLSMGFDGGFFSIWLRSCRFHKGL
jgi:hypothetical protein